MVIAGGTWCLVSAGTMLLAPELQLQVLPILLSTAVGQRQVPCGTHSLTITNVNFAIT